MRKGLIVTALLAGAALLAAAQASEDRGRSVQKGSQPTAQTESIRKDGERVGTDGRSHESGKDYREASREACEHEEDEDRD